MMIFKHPRKWWWSVGRTCVQEYLLMNIDTLTFCQRECVLHVPGHFGAEWDREAGASGQGHQPSTNLAPKWFKQWITTCWEPYKTWTHQHVKQDSSRQVWQFHGFNHGCGGFWIKLCNHCSQTWSKLHMARLDQKNRKENLTSAKQLIYRRHSKTILNHFSRFQRTKNGRVKKTLSQL